jgi:uncharacterized protein (TIGR00251 family)
LNAWRRDGDDLLLELHVQPGAKRNELAGWHGAALRVRVAAPAVDGRANLTLLAYLAEQFGVPKRQVTIEKGATGRRKRVRVASPTRLPCTLEAP